jgi:hypothetical protein
MWDKKLFKIFFKTSLFTICITYIYMDFFIWNIKTLFFFNFSGLIWVDPGWPMKPRTRSFDRVNPRTGFNNYELKKNKREKTNLTLLKAWVHLWFDIHPIKPLTH